MKKCWKAFNRILASPICLIATLFISVAIGALSFYERKYLRAPFQTIYAVSMIMLVLSFLTFLVTYLDREATLEGMRIKAISGAAFFLTFIFITFILRG